MPLLLLKKRQLVMSDVDAITVPPKRPWAFVWHYIRLYPGWYWGIALLQIGAAMTATLMPYAIGRITGAVSDGTWDSVDLWHASLPALGLLFGLAMAQMLFARGATLCMIMVRPQQKIRIIRELFAYLQQHSPRYFSEHFAGSLAHRISEGSIGLLEITWSRIAGGLRWIGAKLFGSNGPRSSIGSPKTLNSRPRVSRPMGT